MQMLLITYLGTLLYLWARRRWRLFLFLLGSAGVVALGMAILWSGADGRRLGLWARHWQAWHAVGLLGASATGALILTWLAGRGAVRLLRPAAHRLFTPQKPA
jgi:hypothetical protein